MFNPSTSAFAVVRWYTDVQTCNRERHWQLTMKASGCCPDVLSQSTQLKLDQQSNQLICMISSAASQYSSNGMLHTIENIQKQNYMYSFKVEKTWVHKWCIVLWRIMWIVYCISYFCFQWKNWYSSFRINFFLNKSSDLSEQRDVLLKNNKPFTVLLAAVMTVTVNIT